MPSKSATTIEANNAFYGLFAGADKLVNNTERLLVLPATTLTEGCYQDMFNGCKGIEKAPELPAPKLEKNCYQEMFYDCAKLNHVKCLASDIKAENSTKDWLGKAGTEATGEKVLETLVPMTANSDDGVPTSWTAQKIVAVTGIELDADEMKLSVGGVGTLKATVEPTDATEKTITWTSSNTSVATVDANGNVTGVAAGTATITAQAGDKTATCVVTVTAAPVGKTIDLSTLEEDCEAQNGDVLTRTLGANVKITIAAGATVTLDGVTITGEDSPRYNWAGITCEGDATIILKDGTTNTVKGFLNTYPGIHPAVDHKLTIKGTGSLTASSNGQGAGIGGGYGIACGNIIIEGGTITATGGSNAAGIGSGSGVSCSNITISGGTVTATGGSNAAGIGSGNNGDCGNIEITTDVTKVTATKGDGATNSIGKGRLGYCGTVTIGGVVGAISTSPYTYPAPAVTGHALSAAVVGDVVGSDGQAYDGTDYNNLPTGVVCYVSGGHGLALALADESSAMDWSTAITTAAAHTPTVTGGIWKLATKDEWNNMFTGAGGAATLRTSFSGVGGSNLDSDYYWSSTESDSSNAWMFLFSNGSDGSWKNEFPKSMNSILVRACLAF